MAARTASATSGFTLVELMLALAVLAILATLALPTFGGALERHRLRAAAEGLAADIAEARFEAARRGSALHLSFRTGESWCYAVATAAGCDCRRAQACQLKTVRADDLPGVQLAQAQDLRLEPDGTPGGPADALWHARGGERLSVSATPLGRPRICSPDAGLAPYPRC
jgi:type IV fimbrial biogenesis protein FimT